MEDTSAAVPRAGNESGDRDFAAIARSLAAWLQARHAGRTPAEPPYPAGGTDRRRHDRLVRAVMQNLLLIEAVVARLCRKAPRRVVEAVLHLGVAELISEDSERRARVVHGVVESSKSLLSTAEAGFVNAVLRKAGREIDSLLAAGAEDAQDAALSIAFSHPLWWVRETRAAWGTELLLRLLRHNQSRPSVWLRVEPGMSRDERIAAGLPEPRQDGWIELPPDTPWTGVTPLLLAGRLYACSPATRTPVDLLGVAPGERVLDLCSAPGGKTLQLSRQVGPGGKVVSVDLSGPRLQRLRDNLSVRADVSNVEILEANLSAGAPACLAPANRVLVDVPCSNTGVWRHKADARWRVREADLASLGRLQAGLLTTAAALTLPGGALVYSTCSLERAENEDRVRAWLDSPAGAGFRLVAERRVWPWDGGGDGAYAARLERAKSV